MSVRIEEPLGDPRHFCAVYTIEFDEAISVLHCFQKKSKKGAKTRKQDKELIDRRLKAAKASMRTG